MERKGLVDAFKRGFHLGRNPQETTSVEAVPVVKIEDLPDVTAEEVRVRREASAAKRGAVINYEVLQELVIPNSFHTGEALLAPIIVTAASYGGWHISASPRLTSEQVASGEDPQQVLGKIIYNGPRISTDEALAVANEWVEDSCTWVPDQRRVPVPNEMKPYAGVNTYLVRGN